MFARTERLILRPAWPEDAPALARALSHPEVARNLRTIPSGYGVAEALDWIGRKRDPRLPDCLLMLRTRGALRLVGGCGIARREDGTLELGYWIDRAHWGLGFATEAARAVMRFARATGLGRIRAAHFLDNPASGRVLRKIGFQPTGRIEAGHSRSRSGVSAMLFYEDMGQEHLRDGDMALELYNDAVPVAA